jgi:hypothetical protein
MARSIISLPGSNYQVTFQRLADVPGISASHNIQDDEDAPITPLEFLERAWGIARDKARELGWIDQRRERHLSELKACWTDS